MELRIDKIRLDSFFACRCCSRKVVWWLMDCLDPAELYVE